MQVIIRLNEDEIGPSIIHGIPRMGQFMEDNYLELTKSRSSYSELELEYKTIKEEEPLICSEEILKQVILTRSEETPNVYECEQDKSESDPIF